MRSESRDSEDGDDTALTDFCVMLDPYGDEYNPLSMEFLVQLSIEFLVEIFRVVLDLDFGVSDGEFGPDDAVSDLEDVFMDDTGPLVVPLVGAGDTSTHLVDAVAVPMDIHFGARRSPPPPPTLRVNGKRRRLNDVDDADARKLAELLLLVDEDEAGNPQSALQATRS
ncbi:unnamed protein product [Peronospora belbahrii]|uniref:Uncharacterized protein n=1 Tax=Peronospora belbahrii TaxID=622444 RepID=A0ABN8D0Y0_9STRA|nr:unnamed protein product [Peronospora belbahrii]